jgi:N-acetylglucosamine malate deacetylase 1
MSSDLNRRGFIKTSAALGAMALAGRAAQAEEKKTTAGDTSAKKKLRIVFFGAHCDDSEVSVGGLMAKLAAQGHEVISAYGTTHRGTRTCFGKPEDTVRRAESSEACEILGAAPYFFPYPHEGLFADEQTIAAVRKWLEEVNPDIVVAQWPIDTHPNHQAVASLTMQCYNHGGRIWGESPDSAVANREKAKNSWNLYFYESWSFGSPADVESLAFTPSLYLDIEDVLEQKKKVVDCFKSQADYNLWEGQELCHLARGKECGVKRAETLFLVEAKPGCPLLPVELIAKRK